MGWVLSRATATVEKVATQSSENCRAQIKNGHARSGAEETLRSDTSLELDLSLGRELDLKSSLGMWK